MSKKQQQKTIKTQTRCTLISFNLKVFVCLQVVRVRRSLFLYHTVHGDKNDALMHEFIFQPKLV